MLQRPNRFRLNRYAWAANGLMFAGIGGQNCIGSALFADSSLWGNHGTLTNMDPATDWSFSPFLGRKCLNHDGSDDVVAITDSARVSAVFADISNGTDAFTLAAWFRWTGTTGGASLWYPDDTLCELRVEGSSVPIAFSFGVAGNVLSIGRATTTGTVSPVTASTAVGSGWRHGCVTVNGNAVDLYLDGVPDGTGTFSGYASGDCSSGASNSNLQIGARTTNAGAYANYWAGDISDMLIIHRALSLSEIQQLADPSNIMLSGLILPPMRRLFPSVIADDSGIVSTIQLPTFQLSI